MRERGLGEYRFARLSIDLKEVSGIKVEDTNDGQEDGWKAKVKST